MRATNSKTQLIAATFVAGFFFLSGMSKAAAADNAELAAYFGKKVSQMQNSLASLGTPDDDPTMELQSMNIDIAPTVNFGLSGFLNLTVAPEIDFVLVLEEVKQ